MLINGIDISSLGVKLYDRVINSNSINTVDDWLDGDIQPTNIRQQEKFKYIQLSFLVLGRNEDDAYMRISRLTKELKKATIKFDDINLTFDVAVYGSAKPERLKNGNFIVSYSLRSDYAKGSREIYTTNANLTNAFRLNLLYYKNSTDLLSSESVIIKASSFKGDGDSLASVGIDLDKFLPEYYNHGIATNLGNLEITYANLQLIGTLIINYEPTQFNLGLSYLMDDGSSYFNEILRETITFTYPQLQSVQTIGQLIRPQRYQPEGYTSEIIFDGELTVESLLELSPIQVLYRRVQNARTKNVLVGYYNEDDNGNWAQIITQVVNINETQFYDGITLGDLINISAHQPNRLHYNTGYIDDHNNAELVSYDDIELSYSVRYPRLTNVVFVEYYAGVYPGWYRIATTNLPTKYKDSYEENFSLEAVGLDTEKYHTGEYLAGQVYNTGSINSYDDLVNTGVIQVYYRPIDYTISVNFYTEGNAEPNTQTFTINALDFFNDPVLTDIIPINDYKPEGYQFDISRSYDGEITLSALTQASPLTIMFEEIEADRTKNVLIHYKQELSSVFSAINTSLITINESDCVGGVRLRDLINLDLYKPTYYESGIMDGVSSTSLMSYDDIASEYSVLYMASYYSTPVRYYTDDVDDANWIGSASITYRIIDFETTTTLYDLGLNVNLFKPSYCDDGALQYRGPVNFSALREVQSIDIVYDTIDEPGDDDGIDYPHRFLFLQHNDLGDYEGLHPEWTLNHAYINTGVQVEDMSKLTVIMECERVDANVPLHDVNGAYGYLFGSHSAYGSYYMRFNNQTQYHSGSLTGVNTYEAKAGYYSNQLTLTEDSAIGWSENSGIYASARDGYSNATFTYTNPLQTENVRMPYPLYLFANNNAGNYQYGLAGIGIYGCRIYYDNLLVRDFIPVQFYDKIGDQVAPSNCLYDKITKTFFEDATGMKSFNIRDDDRYEDTNPDHKIGFCYVNYYQNQTRFKTALYYFRMSDFIDKVYNPYTVWQVEENQPAYYKPGTIVDFASIDASFNGLNGRSFDVVYEEDENVIIVNYYKDDGEGEPELLETENIILTERMFYQVPTFGDIVRLNKYKPEGYKTDFQFNEPKVSLARVLRNSPYNITYVPETEPLEDYTTTIRYIKKVFGIRTYEVIDEITLHFDQTDFRDGEYIDFYIDKNARKPERFYLDGDNFEWYSMDERIDTPDKLKPLYIISYKCETQTLPVNYYTDDWDEANLIASTNWNFRLDDFDPEYPFYIVDQLPNNYINKYRPANCDGGVLQNSNVAHTFFSLVELDEIAIVYDSIEEPHDPTEAYYEKKVLYWGDISSKLYPSDEEIMMALNGGAIPYPWQVPYIDVGYTPKEIGRLRVEWTGASKPCGVSSNLSSYSRLETDYTACFGYSGMGGFSKKVGKTGVQLIVFPGPSGDFPEGHEKVSDTNQGSKGYFSITPRLPSADGYWVYTMNGPSTIDGQTYAPPATSPVGTPFNEVKYNKPGIYAGFRRGIQYDTDDNYNTINVFNDYRFSKTVDLNEIPSKETDGYVKTRMNETGNWFIADPFTVVLDAYNDYCSIWNYHDSNTPMTWKFENTDNPIWEDIERPRAPLGLFTTTNPFSGNVNMADDIYWSYPFLGSISGSYGLAFGQQVAMNPYDTDKQYGQIEYEVEVITQPATENSPAVVEKQTQYLNVEFADWRTPSTPWQVCGVLWSLKVYDRDRLVRDMIPVAKGDIIYDYVMPDNGLFDLITEIFFGNSNNQTIEKSYTETQYNASPYGGAGSWVIQTTTKQFEPTPIYVVPDILNYGKITTNYYDYDNTFLGNKFVDVPTWFCGANTTIEDILEWNDYKPDDFHHDGWLDVDADWSWWGDKMNLRQIYEAGVANVYYKLRTFTKTVVYYRDNVRIASRDLMFSLDDIRQASTLADLGIDPDLYYDPKFKHGRFVYNNQIIADDDVEAFINAPSPIVVYDKLTKAEAPNLFYVEYYRGGAYDENNNIILDPDNVNYFNCNLTAKVLNPSGAIKYYNHYHQALYEDESFDYFIPYQVRVVNKYTGLHYGPARKYKTLAMIVLQDTYTIIQERNGWGRLREYPNAWILLSATEPITGPGQNPAYDIADSTVATIPFASVITITRMTVDRLWCWVPAVESWVKAEDISFDQAGKLYNALQIEVFDLNDIDFTNVASLADAGIDIQKYRMKYHDRSSYVYEGEYTARAFSDLHEIDIVYPETIYHYNCRYYKDQVIEDNYLGASAFSCSISDWNPDWDTFIATSWQTIENPIFGTIQAQWGHSSQSPLYKVDQETGTATYWTGVDNAQEFPIVSEKTMTIDGDLAYHCGTTTDNGKTYDVYMTNYANIIKPFGGYETLEVAPMVYRDTEPTLTWDYFGFEKNLYKPTGYPDGLYIWNPRSWDDQNVKFTFEELLTCGTQYVLYPCFEPELYKIFTARNSLGLSLSTSRTSSTVYNPGIPLDRTLMLRENEENYVSNNYGMSIEGEVVNSSVAWLSDDGIDFGLLNYGSDTGVGPTWYGPRGGISFAGYMKYRKTILNDAKGAPELNLQLGDTLLYDISKYRANHCQLITYGTGNDYDGRTPKYYAWKLNGYYVGEDGVSRKYVEITDNLNLKQFSGSSSTGLTMGGYAHGAIYGIKSFYQNMLIHYFVPVPKGMYYTYNGTSLRIPENGLFDLLTGTFRQCVSAQEAQAFANSVKSSYATVEGTAVPGIAYIYPRHSEITGQLTYTIFDTWDYTTQDIDNIVRLPADVISYVQPDEYSTHKRENLLATTVVPVSKYTDDENNKVVGSWLFSCDQWLKESDATYIPAGTYNITKEDRTISYVEPDHSSDANGNHGDFGLPGYKDPEDLTNPGYFYWKWKDANHYQRNYAFAIRVYYKCVNSNNEEFYFDGKVWLPKAQTNMATVACNKNYAITVPTLRYYEYPVADSQFMIGNYTSGDRITVLYTALNNDNWGYTGEGWIELDGNTSEIL